MPELIMSSIPKSHQSGLCLVRGTQRVALSLKNLPGPLPTAMTLTCPHLAMSLHPLAASPRRPLHESCRCRRAPSDCTHRVAVPLAVVRIALPSPSQLHALRCRPPRGCTHALQCSLRRLTTAWYVFFFLFSTNFLFCGPVTVLSSPPSLTDVRPSSPSRPSHGATTDRDVWHDG